MSEVTNEIQTSSFQFQRPEQFVDFTIYIVVLMILTGFLYCLIIATLSQEDAPYGIQVVTQNFQQVIANKSISVLFYSGACPTSSAFREAFHMAAVKFRQLSSPVNLGTVDCDTEKATCDKYRVSLLPTVLTFAENGTYQKQREQAFIAKAGIIFQNQILAENIQKWLEEQPHYVVVVLEEEGFGAEKRLEKQKVVYLHNTDLYEVMLGYTRGRVGCWIFQYHEATSRLKKYICGSGMDPKEISSNINKFLEGSLKYFKFVAGSGEPQFSNEELLNHNQLLEIYESNASPKVILYDSRECWYCEGVAAAVSVALQRLSNPDLKFYHYLCDINQIPHSKTIMSLPHLELWIGDSLTVYSGRFTQKDIRQFLQHGITQAPSRVLVEEEL